MSPSSTVMSATRSETTKMNFDELAEFSKEFKRFSKKYKSLFEDLGEFKRIISVVPFGNSKHFSSLVQNEERTVIKARLFCRHLKGSSLRVIYAFRPQNQKIVFIEIYFKGEKADCDHERIKSYLKLFT